MKRLDFELLKRFASTYIWWQTPEESLLYPERIIAQVMDIGDWDDVVVLMKSLGDDYLTKILTHAEAGQFRPISWHFWHYKLGLVTPEVMMPGMPTRKTS